MQFPTAVCTYERLNYCNSVIIVGDNMTSVHGPYQQYGPDTASEMITPPLERGKEYILMVAAISVAGVLTSRNYTFSKLTLLQCGDQYVYRLVTISS